MSEREPTAEADRSAASATPEAAGEPELAAADLLVEEISIDGICGVY